MTFKYNFEKAAPLPTPYFNIEIGTQFGDTLTGGAGRDLVLGLDGNDRIFAGADNDRIFAGAGKDTIFAGLGNDLVFAGTGNDVIHTGRGNDTVYAGAGNDRILAKIGFKTIFGGAGYDTVEVNASFNGSGFADIQPGGLNFVTFFGFKGGLVMRGVEAVEFTDYTLYLDGSDNLPYADARIDQGASIDEDSTLSLQSSLIEQLAYDPDIDEDDIDAGQIEVVFDDVSAAGATVSRIGVSDDYAYDPGGVFDYLKAGETATDTLGVTFLGDAGGSVTSDYVITITGVNDAPEFAPHVGTVSAFENSTDVVTTLAATDAEGDTLGYSLSGADAALFAIDSDGNISFVAAPDFEAPQDSNSDNAYELSVTADDGNGGTTSTGLIVQVQDVDEFEPPVGDVLINEFQPNPTGSDPANVSVELKGSAGAAFSGWLLSIENDGTNGTVDRAAQVSGTFDSNGLLSVEIPDLENPSFTFVLASDFTGSAGSTDIDSDDDGTVDDVTAFGTILDAIGIPDSSADAATMYGTQLGGADFAYTGDEPKLVFRDGADDTWYAINDPAGTEAISLTGDAVSFDDFDTNPENPTFGAVNPSFATAPAPVYINEFQPNPTGSDPANVSVELLGGAGEAFAGWLISIENDGANGTVDRATQVSGTFDSNGLLVVEIPDLENPSFTFVLASDFTGSVGTTDVDADDDGTVDDVTAFGTIIDAIGIPDSTSDAATMYGSQLGGTDFAFTGDEPKLVFRDSATLDWYAINDPAGTEAIDLAGNAVAFADFDTDPEATSFGVVNPALGAAPLSLVINEINADPDSTTGDANGDGDADFSDDEFVEIVNTGTSAADLSGVTLMDGAALRHTFADGTTLEAGGVIVVFGGGTPTGTFDGAQVVTASSGALGLNNGGDTVTLSNPDGTEIASVTYGSDAGDNQSLERSPALTGDFAKSGGFTPGTVDDSTPPPTGDMLISTIQGSGDASTMVGQTVTVTAIVVGDFQDDDADTARNLDGFFLQDETTDGDASTSDGIFVFEGSTLLTDVSLGDRVTVTGTVSEFFGMTQISASSVTLAEAGAVADVTTLSATVDLDAAPATLDDDGDYVVDLEAYEGMLVTIPETLTVSEMFNFDRFGEVRLSANGQPNQFTQNNDPDVTGFDAHLQAVYSDSIVYDDGKTVQNPAIPFAAADMNGDGVFDSADPFTMGDTITNATGVLNYGFDEFRMHSIIDGANSFVDTDTRDATPPSMDEQGGAGRSADLTIASFNVLNFFTTLDENGNTSGPAGLEPRGADNAAEYDRQLEKLLTTLEAMDADIFGLVELENEFGDQNGDGTFAIEAIVEALNALDAYAPGTWAYVDPGRGFVDTSDAIAVGMIYKTSSVSVTGDAQILDDSVLGDLPGDYGTGPVFDGPSTNRAPLAANFTYEYQDTGGNTVSESFTVAVTHMKSKGGSGSNGDADAGDGAGNFNETRTEGVEALTDWLDPTRDGAFADADQIVLGDFNAYAQEDPIDAMLADGYSDLDALFNPGSTTFVFDGQTGTLDYGFASQSILGDVTHAEAWHINSPEPDIFDYNTDFGRDADIFDGTVPFRSSDHDPLLIGLNFTDDDLIVA